MSHWHKWYLRGWAALLGALLGWETYGVLTYYDRPHYFPTLSEIIVNALTPFWASVITIAICAYLCWHWYQVYREMHR